MYTQTKKKIKKKTKMNFMQTSRRSESTGYCADGRRIGRTDVPIQMANTIDFDFACDKCRVKQQTHPEHKCNCGLTLRPEVSRYTDMPEKGSLVDVLLELDGYTTYADKFKVIMGQNVDKTK